MPLMICSAVGLGGSDSTTLLRLAQQLNQLFNG